MTYKEKLKKIMYAMKDEKILETHLCLQNPLKIVTRICQFSQYLETKLLMLFEIAKSVEIVIILGK